MRSIPISRGVLDTTICDEVCQWIAVGRWFSLGTQVSSTNKTDRHDRTEILLKMALNAIYKPYYKKTNKSHGFILESHETVVYMLPLNYAILYYHSI